MYRFLLVQQATVTFQTQNEVRFHLYRENKFFKQMSMFIETRNPIQCRSQCHKLLRKHKTFYNAIAHFKEGFDLEVYDNIYKTYSKCDLIRFKGP